MERPHRLIVLTFFAIMDHKIKTMKRGAFCMLKKTKRFLFASLIGLIILCIIIFSWAADSIGKKSQNTLNEIGTLYMSEMSKQLQEKFEALIDLRLSQVEGIVRRTPPETASYGEEMLDELALGALAQIEFFDLLARLDGLGHGAYSEYCIVVHDYLPLVRLHLFMNSATTGFAA